MFIKYYFIFSSLKRNEETAINLHDGEGRNKKIKIRLMRIVEFDRLFYAWKLFSSDIFSLSNAFILIAEFPIYVISLAGYICNLIETCVDSDESHLV